MPGNAAVLTIFCVFQCFAMDFTFPFHREKRPFTNSYGNHSKLCAASIFPVKSMDRAKKKAVTIENMENEHGSAIDKKKLSDEDFRHYEQLVIMKKYPYLDPKELDLKYSSMTYKNPRESLTPDSGNSFGSDPNLCEAREDLINVEIINRGLTGFSVPTKYSKNENVMELKLGDDNSDKTEHKAIIFDKSSSRDILHSLRDDVIAYKEKKKP